MGWDESVERNHAPRLKITLLAIGS